MAKPKANLDLDPDRGPIVSVRFIVALVLIVVGVVGVIYLGFKVDFPQKDINGDVVPGTGSGPKKILDFGLWSYAVAFGTFFVGLMISAHPDTPLGRGRGVVVGMLGCFLIGLAWICTFYAIANGSLHPAVFDDLAQKNLVVGIAFMAVGFTFATRWE